MFLISFCCVFNSKSSSRFVSFIIEIIDTLEFKYIDSNRLIEYMKKTFKNNLNKQIEAHKKYDYFPCYHLNNEEGY